MSLILISACSWLLHDNKSSCSYRGYIGDDGKRKWKLLYYNRVYWDCWLNEGPNCIKSKKADV